MNELALFAGAGGGILGGMLLGWRTVAAVEIEDYPRRVLLQRQADGILPRFPIWDDVCTFDGKPWRGKVDVISGGFPCQDISCAGKGEGIEGKRSGLWGEMARIVDEVRPRHVFVENSPALTSRGLGRVLGDLAAMGYDAQWGVLGAVDAGAPHKRERIWIVADAGRKHGGQRHPTELDAKAQERAARAIHHQSGGAGSEDVANANGEGSQEREGKRSHPQPEQPTPFGGSGQEGEWWESEPAVGRVANGVAHRVDRLKAIGNGQVPAVVALAWEVLS